jgi:hypothetical protein
MNNIDEKIINFKKAIKENRSKSFVYERFQEYLDQYDQMADPSLSRKLSHRDLFLDYTRYMAKSGESQRDIQMHYKKGDENKDYFEYMDKEDIPKDVD